MIIPILINVLTIAGIVFGAIILFYFGFFVLNPFKRPYPTESDYTYARFPFWELYYSSKYVIPVKKPFPGTSLDTYFREMKKPESSKTGSVSHRISISAVGDIMFRQDVYETGAAHLWDHVADHLFGADIVTGNLEFPVNPETNHYKVLRYSVQEEEADSHLFRENRKFSFLSIGNNHINDSASQGVAATCEYLDKRKILFSGANRTRKEQDSFPIIEQNGMKIAMLAYSFSSNGKPLEEGFEFGLNLVRFNAHRDEDYDNSLILRHINLAKERGADLIMAHIHWGVEWEYYPVERLVRRSHELMDAGIDVIMGHHPHMIKHADWYKTKDNRRAVCCFSLGNCIPFAMFRNIGYLGMCSRVNIGMIPGEQGKKEVFIEDVELMPIYFLRTGRGGRSDHRIIPLLKTVEAIEKNEELPFPCNKRQKRKLLSIKNEFDTYFRQSAFTYK